MLDERRRLARELHDGLAQELAYITTESRRLAGHPGAEHLAEAAERALEESRAAILALTRPADEPLERTIAVAAQSIGVRAGIDVTVAVRPGLDVPAEVRQALLRILREAMGNAARHGRAGRSACRSTGPTPLVMAIADDGAGFDLAAARRPDSLGLQSMQERAFNLGGRLSIESVAGPGHHGRDGPALTLRVVIADRSPFVRVAVRSALEAEGIEVVAEADEAAGQRCARSWRIAPTRCSWTRSSTT